MKRFLPIVFALIFLFPLAAQSLVKEDAYYRLWGAVALRSRADFLADAVQYTTLNHEGGVPIKVLEIGTRDAHDGKGGTWIFVMTTSWVWAEGEVRVPQYGKFWVFLRDDDTVRPMR